MIPFTVRITGPHPARRGPASPVARFSEVAGSAAATAALGTLVCPGPGTLLGFAIGAGNALENMRVQDAYDRGRPA